MGGAEAASPAGAGPAQPGTPTAPGPDLPEVGQLAAPDPTTPSTSDTNVARARRRADAVPAEVQVAALEMVGRQLAAMSREPFRRLLAQLIGAAPTPEALRRFADKSPDRWAQALSILGGLAGYERGVVEVNIFNIKGLSDSELMARLAEVEAQVAAARRLPRTLDVADAEVVGAEKASPAARAAGDADA